MFKNLIKKYNERYCIPYQDLADAGESNRLVVHIASILLFILVIVGLLILAIGYHADPRNHLASYFYYIIFFFISLYAFLASSDKKDKDRSKNYLQKTIPLYIVMYSVFAAAIYSFMIGNHFHGFLTFYLTAVIALCTCSFSPIVYLFGLVISTILMAPGIYQSFGAAAFIDAVLTAVLMFCLALYKRRIEKKQIMFLRKQKQSLEAKTFGNFTLIYEGKVVKFSRTKSEELLAYLIYKKGSSIKTKELLFVLYGRQADSAHYGSSLRNLIIDIKNTFEELGIQNFFIAEYNNFRINPEIIKCDYYDLLAGDKTALKNFTGEFLSQYSWAEEAASFLELKVL